MPLHPASGGWGSDVGHRPAALGGHRAPDRTRWPFRPGTRQAGGPGSHRAAPQQRCDCAVVGPLAATAGVSAGWLAAVLTVLCGWSAAFAWRVYRSGLSRVLVAADIVVIAAVVATQGHVAPAGMTAAGTSWILPLASTAIYIALLALRPAVGLPALLLVGAAYVATVPHPADAWFLVVQAAVTAILVGLIRRGGRKADAVVAVSLQAEQERQAEAAGRADEREHHRQLHDTMLSTLTMRPGRSMGRPPPCPLRPPATSTRPRRPGRGARRRGASRRPARPAAAGHGGGAAADPAHGRGGQPAAPGDRGHRRGAAQRGPARRRGRGPRQRPGRPGLGHHRGQRRRPRIRSPVGLPGPAGYQLESISGRMTAAGGTGVVHSTPGHGTTVVLRWLG
jgi:hypothetical protein